MALLVAQTGWYFVFLGRGPVLVSDNVRYESGGYSLATGRGLALPYEMSPDPVVRDWVCTRHPDSCVDGTYPSAQYPPGYQLFIGLLYFFFGRTLWAIALAQLILLWVMFWCLERLASQCLDRVGYWFVVSVAFTYPFMARQATYIMSDHLHATLLLTAMTALLTLPVGARRVLLFGALFGAATFVRTYSVVCIPFLFCWKRLRIAFGASRAQWAAAALLCVLPFAVWTARNAYWFGRFIPFSTVGLGVMLYSNKMEVEIGEVYTPDAKKRNWGEVYRNGEDPANYQLNKDLTREALEWIRTHPGDMVRLLIPRVPRLWISKGIEGRGVSPAYPLFIAYLGGLLLLGVIGMWLGRRDDRLKLVMVVILLYWGFLLHGTAEARRTLALRLPMLIFAGIAVNEGARRFRAQGTPPAPGQKDGRTEGLTR